MTDKTADLAGPGIGNYSDLAKVLPDDYEPLLSPRETMDALFAAKGYIEENLCKQLNLMMVQVPLIVDADSGVNDMLDRDGSRSPVGFHITNDHDQHPIDAQIVSSVPRRVSGIGVRRSSTTCSLRKSKLPPLRSQEERRRRWNARSRASPANEPPPRSMG